MRPRVAWGSRYKRGHMSVQVLLALVDTEMFQSMTPEERDAATQALMHEIEGDPALQSRLYAVIRPSIDRLLAAKTSLTEG